MNRVIIILSFAACLLWQTGCSSSAGVSVGHEGHRHGVGVSGSAGGSGVGVGATAR